MNVFESSSIQGILRWNDNGTPGIPISLNLNSKLSGWDWYTFAYYTYKLLEPNQLYSLVLINNADTYLHTHNI